MKNLCKKIECLSVEYRINAQEDTCYISLHALFFWFWYFTKLVLIHALYLPNFISSFKHVSHSLCCQTISYIYTKYSKMSYISKIIIKLVFGIGRSIGQLTAPCAFEMHCCQSTIYARTAWVCLSANRSADRQT